MPLHVEQLYVGIMLWSCKIICSNVTESFGSLSFESSWKYMFWVEIVIERFLHIPLFQWFFSNWRRLYVAFYQLCTQISRILCSIFGMRFMVRIWISAPVGSSSLPLMLLCMTYLFHLPTGDPRIHAGLYWFLVKMSSCGVPCFANWNSKRTFFFSTACLNDSVMHVDERIDWIRNEAIRVRKTSMWKKKLPVSGF